MEFPIGPRDEREKEEWQSMDKAKEYYNPRQAPEYLTDAEIKEVLLASGCTVRRIVRTDKMRHVYYGCPDNRAKKDALEMAYKLKNRFAPDRVFVPIAPNPETENMVLGVLGVFVQKAQGPREGNIINITPEGDEEKDHAE